MEIPEDETCDALRITSERARNECEARETQETSGYLFQDLRSKTQGCIGPCALSLAKHGGTVAQPEKAAASVKSLIQAHKQNQQQQPVPHTHNETLQDYDPKDESALSAFEESHVEGNAHEYYVINWRRCQFINTRIKVHHRNCPDCYQAHPLGDQCFEGCTNQLAKVIYFRPPGPRMCLPAIPHELARACGSKGQRFVIDEYELLKDNKEKQKSHLRPPRSNVGCEIHPIDRFILKTSDEFRNKPHFEKETCCITQATQSQINTAINAMMHD